MLGQGPTNPGRSLASSYQGAAERESGPRIFALMLLAMMHRNNYMHARYTTYYKISLDVTLLLMTLLLYIDV